MFKIESRKPEEDKSVEIHSGSIEQNMSEISFDIHLLLLRLEGSMGEEEREGVGDETEHVHRQEWTNRCSYFKDFFFSAFLSIAMAHDWRKDFTVQQLALIDAHTIPKDFKNSIPSLTEDADQSELAKNDVVQTNKFSSRWTRCSNKRGSASRGSSIASSSARKVDGEASSDVFVPSGSPAMVEIADGAESHAESHMPAAHIACGVVASIRNSLMPFSVETEDLLQAAQKARIAHLTKRAETGLCNRQGGNNRKDAMFEFLSDLIENGKNKELLVCRRCDFVGLNYVSHQAKGEYKMKLRCSRCNAEYCSWLQDNLFCMRL